MTQPFLSIGTMPKRPRTTVAHRLSKSSFVNWSGWVGVTVVLLYFFRATVFPWFLHLPFTTLVIANGLALLMAATVAASGGGAWSLSWGIVLTSFGLGVTHAMEIGNSALRFVGLMMLVISVGPLVRNPAARGLRAGAWRLVVDGFPVLSGLFVVWYILRLPNFGAGYFSAFMNQCMLAGPFAGIGGAIALIRSLNRRSWKWGLLGLGSIIPVLASGSRVATLATGVTYCFILVRRRPVLGIVGALLLIGAIGVFVTRSHRPSESDSLTAALMTKGTANTRADFWRSRIDEFASSPIVGIGVAMGTESGSNDEAIGGIRVEPGSSYLAILSMTGLLGTMSFFTGLGLDLFRFNRAKGSSMDVQVLSALGVFLAVHGVAEGWVLAFGSPLACLFWLWLGKVGDVAPQLACAKSRRIPYIPRRLAQLQPAPTRKATPSEQVASP